MWHDWQLLHSHYHRSGRTNNLDSRNGHPIINTGNNNVDLGLNNYNRRQGFRL